MIIFVIKAMVIALCLYCFIALALINSDVARQHVGESLDFSVTSENSIDNSPKLSFTAQDNSRLYYRQYGNNEGPLIVVLHGSSAHGGLYAKLSHALSNNVKRIQN